MHYEVGKALSNCIVYRRLHLLRLQANQSAFDVERGNGTYACGLVRVRQRRPSVALGEPGVAIAVR